MALVDLTDEEIRVVVELAEKGWDARGLVPKRHDAAFAVLAKLKALLSESEEDE